MADNTISPVVPNVSGGRTVSTGQKAVTQTSAQSGIDFKSYLGGRTAVQDNSTTFLKRRNSYTLNKNKTKEISIKTAGKNLSAAAEEMDGAANGRCYAAEPGVFSASIQKRVWCQCYE